MPLGLLSCLSPLACLYHRSLRFLSASDFLPYRGLPATVILTRSSVACKFYRILRINHPPATSEHVLSLMIRPIPMASSYALFSYCHPTVVIMAPTDTTIPSGLSADTGEDTNLQDEESSSSRSQQQADLARMSGPSAIQTLLAGLQAGNAPTPGAANNPLADFGAVSSMMDGRAFNARQAMGLNTASGAAMGFGVNPPNPFGGSAFGQAGGMGWTGGPGLGGVAAAPAHGATFGQGLAAPSVGMGFGSNQSAFGYFGGMGDGMGTGRGSSLRQLNHSPLANMFMEVLRSAPLNAFGCLSKRLDVLANSTSGTGSMVVDHVGTYPSLMAWVLLMMTSLLAQVLAAPTPAIAQATLMEVMALVALAQEVSSQLHEPWPALANYFLMVARDFVVTPQYSLAPFTAWSSSRWHRARSSAAAAPGHARPATRGGGGGGSGGGSGGGGGAHRDLLPLPPADPDRHCYKCGLIGWTQMKCPHCHGLPIPTHLGYRKPGPDGNHSKRPRGNNGDGAGQGNGVGSH